MPISVLKRLTSLAAKSLSIGVLRFRSRETARIPIAKRISPIATQNKIATNNKFSHVSRVESLAADGSDMGSDAATSGSISIGSLCSCCHSSASRVDHCDAEIEFEGAESRSVACSTGWISIGTKAFESCATELAGKRSTGLAGTESTDATDSEDIENQSGTGTIDNSGTRMITAKLTVKISRTSPPSHFRITNTIPATINAKIET